MMKYPIINGKRVCNTCHQEKLVVDFCHSKITKSGILNICKACNSAKALQHSRSLGRKPIVHIFPIVDGTKKCNKCYEIKPVTEYTINKASAGGIASYCKTCTNKRLAKKRLEQGKKPLVTYPVIHGIKKCNKCLEDLPVTNFKVICQGQYTRHICKKCSYKYETDKKGARIRIERYQDKINNNPDLKKELLAIGQKARDELSDGYIKKLLCGSAYKAHPSYLDPQLITPDLIELKRKQMLLYRELKPFKSS